MLKKDTNAILLFHNPPNQVETLTMRPYRAYDLLAGNAKLTTFWLEGLLRNIPARRS